jgi:putative ABC transport system substrate-binding protein
MRRREFVTLLGGAATLPLAARAQPPAKPVIGFVHPGSAQSFARPLSAFLKGLGETVSSMRRSGPQRDCRWRA